MGIFGKIWSGVKKAAGVAGKLLQNENARKALAKGVGVAASMIPVASTYASSIQNYTNKGLDKLNEMVNGAPDGNVKSGLEHVQDMLSGAKNFAGRIPALNKYQETLDKLHKFSKDKDVTNLFSTKPKLSNARTNQYRSSEAVSPAGEATVYGQSTQPIVRTKQTFPDGITVPPATIQKSGHKKKNHSVVSSNHSVRIKKKVRK